MAIIADKNRSPCERIWWDRFPETYIKRQVTLHDCLPSWLGDEDKLIEKVYSEEKNIWHRAHFRAGKNLSYEHEEPNKPTYSLSPHLSQFQ
jgi:hypothetical protein